MNFQIDNFINNQGKKAFVYIIEFIFFFILLLIIKDVLYNALSTINFYTFSFGEENAKKIVDLLFITPNGLIFQELGISIRSIIIVVLINFRQNKYFSNI